MIIPIPVPIPAKNGITTLEAHVGRAVGLASSQGVSKLQRRRPAAAPVSTTVIKGVLAKIMPGNLDILNLRSW